MIHSKLQALPLSAPLHLTYPPLHQVERLRGYVVSGLQPSCRSNFDQSTLVATVPKRSGGKHPIFHGLQLFQPTVVRYLQELLSLSLDCRITNSLQSESGRLLGLLCGNSTLTCLGSNVLSATNSRPSISSRPFNSSNFRMEWPPARWEMRHSKNGSHVLHVHLNRLWS